MFNKKYKRAMELLDNYIEYYSKLTDDFYGASKNVHSITEVQDAKDRYLRFHNATIALNGAKDFIIRELGEP